ncbi:unnamed protein product [Orchesella dallaii]|uniref:C2H2-type domain-containing protein n=1 Tax=Orchesella dallaii TaxID=48710 RepID=A0ABP1QL55_9HEXA
MSALQMDISTSSRFQRLNSTDRESDDVAIDYSKSASRVMPEALGQTSYRVPTKGMRKAYPEDQYVSQTHHQEEQQYQKAHQVAVSPDIPRMEQSSPYNAYSQIANTNHPPSSYYATPPPQPYNDHGFNYGYETNEELREYQCLKCGLIFSRESDLHIHYTQDHGYGQSNGGSSSTTSCSSNSGVNGANRGQQSSKNSNSNSQDMFCDKCQLRFHCPLSFRVHQHEHVLPNVQPHYPMSNSHLLSLSYTCEICGANFMSRESLTDHCNAHLYEHVCSESTCGESDTATNSSEDFYPRESSHSQHPSDQYHHKGYMDQGGGNEMPQFLHHQLQQQIGGKADHNSNEQLIVNQGPSTYSSEYSSSYQHEIAQPISSSKLSGIYEPLVVMDNGKRRFQCVVCKKYLSSRIAHEEHLRGKHTGVKPYSCSYCGKRFAVWNTYKHHMSTHKGGVTPLQKCGMCDKRFKTVECLRNHMQREHNCQGGNGGGDGNGNAGYSCQICGKTFVRKMWRTRHYLSHAGQNCFRCELCSCILPDEQSYRMHHESHKASK